MTKFIGHKPFGSLALIHGLRASSLVPTAKLIPGSTYHQVAVLDTHGVVNWELNCELLPIIIQFYLFISDHFLRLLICVTISWKIWQNWKICNAIKAIFPNCWTIILFDDVFVLKYRLFNSYLIGCPDVTLCPFHWTYKTFPAA